MSNIAIRASRLEMQKIAGFMPGAIGAGVGLVGVSLLQKPGAKQDRMMRDMGYLKQEDLQSRNALRRDALLGITAGAGLVSAVAGPAATQAVADYASRQGQKLMSETTMQPLYDSLARASDSLAKTMRREGIDALKTEIRPEIVSTVREELAPLLAAQTRSVLQEESVGVGENIAEGFGNIASKNTRHYIGGGWLADLLSSVGREPASPSKILSKGLRKIR